ncbi:reticulon-4-interacting protein 1, mitochondrial isoform X2 [Fopius arisanus]|uniref:Reticulon-4-interacting protein 1, mitochondrial isoform X2 n=1 Tax=Fopius arisanus TaxID=64838 RepID=A0A0C9QZJ0_9HYME|nr:PREDICTED: reticulon-4-interacting protein 1, mitochondrial-like isoform X2 [Fopius arisanus]XP_011311494.1 PREDICTED: reticulon-4-interacting protein 1, mitochondrial-like isoform X2 [Fopius arisanus]
MEEILFRLGSQIEALQVASSATAQQAYQWLMPWLAPGQQYLQNIYNNQYAQQIKGAGSWIINFFNRSLELIKFQFRCAQINTRNFYQHIGILYLNDVSRRDIAFCALGITIGTLIGYNIGLNWRQTSKRTQYMKAIICHHYVGIEGVAVIDDAELPIIQRSNEVLIQVKAASVNPVDVKICSGYSKYYRRIFNHGNDLPIVLGRDCSGVVIDIGQDVMGLDIGDEVFLSTPSWGVGTMAEYIVVTEKRVAKKPKRITFEASASLPYAGCIAWDSLVNKSPVEEGNAKGKRFLVYGGSTPVGCILIQLIKLWGGYVSVICRADAVKVIKALGGDDIISVENSDIEMELELRNRYHAVFHTSQEPIDIRILKKRVISYGSFVSTLPEPLISDSLGFFLGNLFAAHLRVKLLFQYIFGIDCYLYNDGAKIKSSTLEIIRELVDADKLQSVVCAAFRPNYAEQALQHVSGLNAIGSTIIKFQ